MSRSHACADAGGTAVRSWQYQLSQIKLALAKDPTNAEYLTLQEELQSLIDLTKQYLASQQPSEPAGGAGASTSAGGAGAGAGKASQAGKQQRAQDLKAGSSSAAAGASAARQQHPAFKTGDECMARYSGDGRFYPARITSIGGSENNRVYSIIFQGYSTTELVDSKDVKPLNDNKKRELVEIQEDPEKERKKKKYEKKAETKAAKTAEQGERQKTWQSFAKKSTKKGVVIPGMQGESTSLPAGASVPPCNARLTVAWRCGSLQVAACSSLPRI